MPNISGCLLTLLLLLQSTGLVLATTDNQTPVPPGVASGPATLEQPPSRPIATVPVRAGPLDPLRTLMRENRLEEAALMAGQMLEQHGERLQAGNVHWREVQHLTDLINTRPAMRQQLLSLYGDSAPQALAYRLRLAMILELLDMTDQARREYEAVIAEQDDAAALVRLAVLSIVAGDIPQATKWLLRVPASHADGAVGQLINAQNRRDQSIEKMLATTHAIVIFLDHVDQLEMIQGSRLASQLRRLERSQEGLPYLWDQRATMGDDKQALAQQRRQIHEKLARAMLRVPDERATAFGRLLALAEMEQQDLEPLRHIAREAMLRPPVTMQAVRRVPSAIAPLSWTQGVRDTMRTPAFRSMEEFVASWAQAADQRPWLEALIAELEPMQPERARALALIASLYFCEPGEFLDTAQTYLSPVPGQRPIPGMVNIIDAGLVVRAWHQRQFTELDMTPLLLQAIRGRSYAMFNMQIWIADYAQLLAQRRGQLAVEELFEGLSEHFLGSADQRSDFVARYDGQTGQEIIRLTSQIRNYQAVLAYAMHRPVLLGIGLRHITPMLQHMPREGCLRIEIVIQAMQLAVEADLDALIQSLEGGGFLADGEAFRSHPFMMPDGRQSMLGQLTAMLHTHAAAGAMRQDLQAWLEAQEIDTLGADLLRMMLAEKTPSPEATVEVLLKHAPAITTLSDQGIEQVAAVLSVLELPGDAPLQARLALARLQQAGHDGRAAAVDALIQDMENRMQRGFLHGRQLPELTAPLLQELAISGDMPLAIRLIEETHKIHDQLPAERQVQVRPFLEAAMVRQMLRNPRSPQQVAFINALMHARPDAMILPVNMEGILSQLRQRESLFALLQELDAHVQAPSALGLMPAFQRLLMNFGVHDSARLARWLRWQLMENPNSPVLQDFQAALWMAMRRRYDADDNERWALTQAIEAYALARAEDERIPLSLRCHVLLEVASNLGQESSLLAMTVALLFTEAFRRDQVLPDAAQARALAQLLYELPQAQSHRLIGPLINQVLIRQAAWRAENRPTIRGTSAMPRLRHVPPRVDFAFDLYSLAMALQIDDMALVDRLLEEPGSVLPGSIAAWALLARHGQIERAAQLIAQEHADVTVHFPAQLIYDEQLASQIPSLLAQLDCEDLRLLAHAALAAQCDQPRSASEPDGRTARMAPLAEQVKGHAFSDPAIRDKVLQILVTDTQALKMLRPVLESLDEVTSFSLMLASEGIPSAVTRWLVQARLAAAVVAGDGQAIVDARKALVHAQDNMQRHRPREVCQILSMVVHDFVQECLDQIDFELAVGLCDAVRLVAIPLDRSHVRYQELLVLLHAMADRMQDLDEWQSEVAVARPRTLSERTLWQLAARALAQDAIEPAQRVAGLERLLARPDVVQPISDVHRHLVQLGLINEQEWRTYGTVLCRLVPAGGMSWLRLALAHEQAEQDDLAQEAWAEALAAAQQTDNTHRRANVIREMIRAGRLEGVSALIEQLPPDDSRIRGFQHDLARAERATASP